MEMERWPRRIDRPLEENGTDAIMMTIGEPISMGEGKKAMIAITGIRGKDGTSLIFRASVLRHCARTSFYALSSLHFILHPQVTQLNPAPIQHQSCRLLRVEIPRSTARRNKSDSTCTCTT